MNYNQEAERLCAQIQRGDEDALPKLYKLMEGIIHCTLARYFIPNTDNDDLFALAHYELWYAAKRFDPKGCAFSSYLIMHLHSRMKTELVAAMRQKHHHHRTACSLNYAFPEDLHENFINYFIDDNANTKHEEILADMAVERFFDKIWLPDASRKHVPLLLDMANGYTYEEIAERHGRNIKFVDNALCRLRSDIVFYNPEIDISKFNFEDEMPKLPATNENQ